MALKSFFPEEMINSSSEELTLETIAGKLTHFHEQLHLTHWQTSSYAEHQATGALYEYVQDFKDGLIEKIMGYTGKKPGPYKIDPLTNCTAMQCTIDILAFASKLKAYGEVNKYHDVCNLADELSGEAAKTKFLLTLS